MNDENFPERMYKEHILELYKSPENYGELKNATHKHTETNASCGDEFTMQFIVEDGKIKDVKFYGSGCVMSTVSASLLTSKIKGIDMEEAANLTREDVLDLLKIKVNPGRIKCVLLPLYAVKNAITHSDWPYASADAESKKHRETLKK